MECQRIPYYIREDGYLHYRQLYRLRQTQLAPWWVSKRKRTRQTMCITGSNLAVSTILQFLLPERRLLPDIPGETRWCPCSPSWIIITMNATSFPVLTAATVLPAQQAGTLGKLLVSGRSVEHHARGFMSKYSFLSNLRIRASYGINGHAAFGQLRLYELDDYTSKYMGNGRYNHCRHQ